ncbi:MAG: Usg family protein [Alphaproteobacteria bacterium CG_4_9_14_3_um_filter_47_13]|nr:MAG: Usg family protein [Alphaproteobacteria bacterium CG_4_9_14_3_um_filter_47_13]
MANFEKQIIKDYRLTTAEIIYHMPDYPDFLQSYIWQEYDISPKFPVLHNFLTFWGRELDGKVHSVYVASKKLITSGDTKFYNHELTLQ